MSCRAGVHRVFSAESRYNFIIQDNKARLIDFEKSQLCHGTTAYMRAEMESLSDELVEDTGRGAGSLAAIGLIEKTVSSTTTDSRTMILNQLIF
jgi:hypothetical protein